MLKDVVESKKFLNEDLLDQYPTLTVPSPALIALLLANIFPNRLAPYVPNSTLRTLCSFPSFLIVSLTPSNNNNNNSESSRDFTIFKICTISSFEILRLYYDQILRFFLCIPASAADAAAVNANRIKTLLANG